MSITLPITQLYSIDNLFSERKKQIVEYLNNLKLVSIKDDNAFRSTMVRIKNSFLLEPVTIGEPKITGNRPLTKQMPPHYQNLWGGPQTFNQITVSFPYTGSSEVFSYRANGSLVISIFYLPSGSSIEVDVLLPQLNKEQALSNARKEMAATIELIKLNNPSVEAWSANMSTFIEEQAVIKRKELLELYS